MKSEIIRIATRKSPLALWQAHHVADLLKQHWPNLTIELLPMQTSGDKFLSHNLVSFGGKGLFVKELEEALLENRADLAVHSMKDVPAAFPPGLFLSAIIKRHNPLDAFLSAHYSSLEELPSGSVIGTASLRRQSQLLFLRPDLTVNSLRGNIHTRIAKMETGAYDAIILAASGLERMDMQHLIQQIFTEEEMLPACGQGALGIECRADDKKLHQLLSPLNDPLTALCVETERAVNAALGGNCHTPIAIYCKPEANDYLLLKSKIISPDGKRLISNVQRGLHTESSRLAHQCAQSLLNDGAAELINDNAS